MNRIEQLRKEFKLSQKELADKLHIHQTAVSQWERERTAPSFDLLCQMSALFNVSPVYLMGNSNDRGTFPNSDHDSPAGELQALRAIMLLSGYDLVSDLGEYYFVTQRGRYHLSEEQTEELLNSSVQYVEFLCEKLERELSPTEGK